MMKSVRAELKRMDPNIDPKDAAYPYALVLLTAAQVGPNADKIARRARLPRSQARRLAADCRRTGLFRGKHIAHSGWWDKKEGGMAFWLDVCVAQGLLKRSRPATGRES